MATLPGNPLPVSNSGDMQAARDEAMSRKLQTMSRGVSADKAKEVGREFEAMFLSQMLQPMFDTVKTNSLFGGGHGEDAFKGIMVDEYAKQIARRGTLGIADLVSRQVMEYGQQQQSARETVADAAAAYRARQTASMPSAPVVQQGSENTVPKAAPQTEEADPAVQAAPREPVKASPLRAPRPGSTV